MPAAVLPINAKLQSHFENQFPKFKKIPLLIKINKAGEVGITSICHHLVQYLQYRSAKPENL